MKNVAIFCSALVLLSACSSNETNTENQENKAIESKNEESSLITAPEEDKLALYTFNKEEGTSLESTMGFLNEGDLLVVYKTPEGEMKWKITSIENQKYEMETSMNKHACTGSAADVKACAFRLFENHNNLVFGKSGSNLWAEIVKTPVSEANVDNQQ